jgi:hypothetical protein
MKTCSDFLSWVDVCAGGGAGKATGYENGF